MRGFLLVLIGLACRSPQQPRTLDDPTSDAVRLLLRRQPVAQLSAMPLEQREEAVFAALFNTIDGTKPRPFDQATYDQQLARGERAKTEAPWHVRWGVRGTADLDADAVRFYFDVVPEHAAALADFVVSELDRRGVARYSFKVLATLELFDVPVPAVLYVEAPDVEHGRELAIAFVHAHPGALWPDVLPFALRLAPGLAMADEIGKHGPPGIAGNSFGGAMARLVALALDGAPPTLDAAQLAARVRDQLRRAGFDPARPWMRPRGRSPASRSRAAPSPRRFRDRGEQAVALTRDLVREPQAR